MLDASWLESAVHLMGSELIHTQLGSFCSDGVPGNHCKEREDSVLEVWCSVPILVSDLSWSWWRSVLFAPQAFSTPPPMQGIAKTNTGGHTFEVHKCRRIGVQRPQL